MDKEQIDKLIGILQQALDGGTALGEQLVAEYSTRHLMHAKLDTISLIGQDILLLILIGVGLILIKKGQIEKTVTQEAMAVAVGLFGLILIISTSISIDEIKKHYVKAASPTYSLISDLIDNRRGCGCN